MGVRSYDASEPEVAQRAPVARGPSVPSSHFLSVPALLALQRSAGNARVSRWLQRWIELDGTGWRENDQPPRAHIALGGGWVPFDRQRWDDDPAYQQELRANAAASASPATPKTYEETVESFIMRTGVTTVYRSVRIHDDAKKKARDRDKTVRAPAEPGPMQGLEGMKLMAAYQQLQQWPADVPIMPVDALADLLPVQHVSGDNYASQFISTALNLERARYCSLTSYSAGTGKVRLPSAWAPVVEIDLMKLGGNARIIDLRTKEARKNAGFFASAWQIDSLADADEEILITGSIPALAVVKVFDVVRVVSGLKDTLRNEAVAKLREWLKGASSKEFGHLRPLLDLEAPTAEEKPRPQKTKHRRDDDEDDWLALLDAPEKERKPLFEDKGEPVAFRRRSRKGDDHRRKKPAHDDERKRPRDEHDVLALPGPAPVPSLAIPSSSGSEKREQKRRRRDERGPDDDAMLESPRQTPVPALSIPSIWRPSEDEEMREMTPRGPEDDA